MKKRKKELMKRFICIGFIIFLIGVSTLITFGANLSEVERGKHTHVVMVTSLDSNFGRYPLLGMGQDVAEIINQSPYDAIALNVEHVYAGGNPPNFEEILEKAIEFRTYCQKPIWPRVNLNRIIQRHEGHTVSKDNDYFHKIKVMDVYNESGALNDFYEIWKFAFRLAKENGAPGIVFDAEEYNWNISKSPIQIAKAHKKSVEETVQRLRDIGRELADMASEVYPEAKILSFFTNLHNMPEFGYASSVAYIHEGILLQAKAKEMKIELIDGGENDVNYVNPSLEALQSKINRRLDIYKKWLKEYPDNFTLGGTITVWNDVSQIGGWVKRHSEQVSAPFQKLEDFEPMIRELCSRYEYLWIYVPSVTDYNPFIEEKAKVYNEKLGKILEGIRRENCID